MLANRLREVRDRIERACARAGRSPEQITVIAVTKVFPSDAILEAHSLGLRHFGENYVQEFEDKAPAVRHLPGAVFHLIGHLQSNKAVKAANLFNSIQTVDSAKLARKLGDCGKPLDVWIEVKLSPEESKHGAAPEKLSAILDTLRSYPSLHVQGLMTMPPWSDDPEPSRPFFRQLAELAHRHDLPSLSMGMSHDFEVAIEEGATHIRVGTALFGRRPKKQ